MDAESRDYVQRILRAIERQTDAIERLSDRLNGNVIDVETAVVELGRRLAGDGDLGGIGGEETGDDRAVVADGAGAGRAVGGE